jgi:hypothetical protein
MAKNTIADLDVTAANNTDFLNTSTAGTADANTIDTMLQNFAGITARFYGDIGGIGTVGGTADVITLTSTSTYQTLESGLTLSFKAGSANTGAATLNLDGLGAKAIRRQGDSALVANDIIANGRYLIQYDAAYNSTAGAWVLLNPAGATVTGRQTAWIPASGMTPATTNGAAPGTAETTTNKVMVKTLDFDASTEEFAQFMVRMPKGWNEGTVILQPVWTHAATTTNFGVAFGFEAVAFANDDALDTAWGTEIVVTDTGGTTDDVYIAPESSAVTVAGSPSTSELVAFRVTRVVGNAGDTLAVDAKLIGVSLFYTIDAGTDD